MVAAALAVCMLSAGFVVATVTGSGGPPGALDAVADQYKISGDRPAGTTVRLATMQFDPLKKVPEVADALSAKNPRHWLVQVHGPASRSDRDAITAAGGRVLGFLPDMTYVVAADAPTAAKFGTLAAVRWVGAYHPRYKLSPALDARKFEAGQLRVMVHKDADVGAVRRSLERIGGVKVVETGHRVVVVDASKRALNAIARVEDVEWVEQRPEYKLHNQNALWVTDTGMRNELGAALPGRLDGAGQTAAVADTGINYIPDPNGRAQQAFSDCTSATSCKLASYVQTVPGNSTEALGTVSATGTDHRKMAGYFNLDEGDPLPRSMEGSWHGTHVGGSVAADYPAADGAYGTRSRESDGIAPAAHLTFQDVEAEGGLGGLPGSPYDLFDQVYDLNNNDQYDPLEDARTHNNSYGAIYPEFDDGGGALTDEFVYDHPDMTIVFSASNDGPDPATLAGGPQESKNVITSCASANGSQPLVAPDAAAIFSSHGPTLDGRIKPDVCTPGQIIVSPKGGTTDADHYLQGTSMSGPILVGLTTLVRQYYYDGFGPSGGAGYARGARNLADRHNPSAALVKATTINSAQRMRGWYTGDRGAERADDGMWPSNGQGFGKVELDKALYFAGDDRSLFVVDTPSTEERGLQTGLDVTEFIDVAPGQPLDVTLTWTDPPSFVGVGTPVLVNDLNLVVVGPDGTEYVGNEFTTQSPVLGPGGDPGAEIGESVPGGAADFQNTVEAVRLQTPPPGRYEVRVVGENVPMGPQGYALAVSGRLATDARRIVFDAPKYQPGSEVNAYLLGTDLTGDEIDGFTKLGPSLYGRTLTASGSAVTITAGGVTASAPVDSTAPMIQSPFIDSVTGDLVRVSWTTDEKSTGTVVVSDPDGNETEYPDVHVRDGLEGLDTPQNETKGVYLDRPVVSTNHVVTVTGLDPGTTYSYRIDTADEAGNSGTGNAGSFTTTGAVFAPNAPDIAMLLSGDTTTGGPATAAQSWGTSTQLYAGNFQPLPASLVPELDGTPIGRVEALPAFMFRMPESIDPARITGAAVQLMSGHDIVNTYQDPTVYSMDLLDSSVEADWGPGKSYESVDSAPADTHLFPEPTDRRGAGTQYAWHVACNEVDVLKENLAEDGDGERRAAFRLRGLVDAPESLFSFEPGYGRRSRGPQLRPRLVLFLDGHDPQPCQNTAAPKIEGVLVDHVPNAEGVEDSAVVSWRTDVPSDSTVYFRKVGDPDWIPVSAPSRTTQHFVRVGALEPNGLYEFVVRSATCNGLSTTADNGGKAFALFNDAFQGPRISGVHAFKSPDDETAEVVKWSTDQVGTSVVHYGKSPDNLDQSVSAPEDADPTSSHELVLEGLDACTRYYFVVETTNGAGKKSTSEVLAFDRPPEELTPVTTFDFESDAQGWANQPDGGNGDLTDPLLGTPISDNPTVFELRSEPATGGSQAWRTVLANTGTPGYSSNVDIRLVSPPIALPPDDPYVRFAEWFELEGDGDIALGTFERPEVEFSLGGPNGPWVALREGTASQNADFPAPSTTTLAFPEDAAGQTVHVAFRFRSDPAVETQGGGWAIDDVEIMSGVCPSLAGVVAGVDVAPEKPPTDEAAITASGVSGPVPPVAGATAAGNFLSLDAPTAEALAAGTCRCGPITYESATGPAPPPVPKPQTAPSDQGRGSLPATGGTTALWSFAVLGLALLARRLSAGRRAVRAR